MPDTIIVEFSQHDHEIYAALTEVFGSDVEFLEVRNFDSGTVDIVQAILPVIPALIPVLVDYFSRPKSPRPTKRAVVTATGSISLEGFSIEEVERIVDKIRSRRDYSV